MNNNYFFNTYGYEPSKGWVGYKKQLNEQGMETDFHDEFGFGFKPGSAIPEPQPEPEPTTDKYLTFTANENGSSVGFYYNRNSDTGKNMQYSTDGGATWQDYTIGVGSSNVVPITIEEGESVKFRGENENLAYVIDEYNYITIRCAISGSVAASGDVTSLLNGAGGDVSVPQRCYSYMFSGCTGLTTAPELPATTLAQSCYSYMFSGCTSLTTAPELPATTLAQYCYQNMFYGCTALATAPELPATTLENGCYSQMFAGCTSLTTAPELPATILAANCYQGMFWNCTSLTTAPELPATTLVNSCYGAVEMMPGVYMLNGMFEGCSSLNYIKAMFTTEPSGTYLAKWVTGVSENGTFVMNSAAEWNPEDYRGENGIPVGWTVETASE